MLPWNHHLNALMKALLRSKPNMQVTQVAVAEQQNSIGEIEKFQSFSRLQKLFRVIALVIKFVRILQSRMEDKKKEEKYTRVLRSTFKEIKRDKEAKTVV